VDADVDPGPAQDVRAALHLVCGSNYAERDSIPIPPPSRQVVQMETSADGREVVVATDLELIRFDATTMQVKSKGLRPMSGPFFLSRATGRMILPDVGSTIVASTGIIYLLDSNLEL